MRLSLADREELSRGLVAGDALRQIAVRVARPVSTLTREVERNGGRASYLAWQAETAVVRRAIADRVKLEIQKGSLFK
jgi:IS30 family transposase